MSHPIDLHIGGRLRKRRRELGLSGKALGQAVGLTAGSVSRIERGLAPLGAAHLQLLGLALDVPITFFFDDFDTDGGSRPGPKEIGQLVDAFYQVADPRIRKEFIGLIKTVAEG